MKLALGKNVVFEALSKSYRILPQKFRRKGLYVMLALLLNSILELFGLAALIPVFSIVLQEGIIQNNEILRGMYEFSGLESENSFILMICIGVIIVVIVKNIISLLIFRGQAEYAYSIYTHLGGKLQRYFYTKGLDYFKKNNANVIARDINFISMTYANALLLHLLSIMNEFLILLMIVIGIFLYNAKVLLLVALIVGPAFFIFYRSVRKKIQLYNNRRKDLGAELALALYQSIYGYADIVINNRQEWFFKQYQERQKELKQIQRDLYMYAQAPTKVIESAMVVGVFCLILFGLYFFEDRSALVLMLGVFAVAAYRILPSINRMLVSLMSIKGNMYVFDTLEQMEDVDYLEEIPEPMIFRDKIEIKDLHFRYHADEEEILKGVSFEIPQGSIVGIIGKSGSGKTTLINIILRFLKETQGSIWVDGKRLNDEDVLAWRGLIGYVPQEVYLAEGSIRENIVFGSDKVDEERIREVVKLASLQDLIDSFSTGLDTIVGERGSRISGGQKQRIGIARALYSGAQVLFMDEATSALDFDTELEITESLRTLKMNNYTIIAISHRLSMLKHSDFIIEVVNGEIRRTNTYENLIKEYA